MKNYFPFVGLILAAAGSLATPSALAKEPKAPITFDYPDQRSPGLAVATVEGIITRAGGKPATATIHAGDKSTEAARIVYQDKSKLLKIGPGKSITLTPRDLEKL